MHHKSQSIDRDLHPRTRPSPQRHPYPGTCVRPLSRACIPKTLVVYFFTSAKGFPVDCKFLEFMVGIQCLKLLRCIHVVADGCGEFFLTTKRCPVVWLCRRRLSSVPLAGSGLFQAFAVPNGADYKGDSACFLWKLRGFLFGTGLALTMQLYKRRPNTTAGLRALCTPTTPSLTPRPMRKTELALTAFHVEEVTLGPELTLPTRLQVAPRLRFQKRSSRRAR